MSLRHPGSSPGRLLVLGTIILLAVLGLAAPARAAVPDRFGFLLFSGGTVVASGTYPTGSAAGPIVVGRYKVVFPGQAASGGVVHVTAINRVPHWCQVDTFGPSGADEYVQISCYKAGGGLDYSDFSVIYDRSSIPAAALPGRFGYVDATAFGGIVSQFNSAGATNSVTHLAVGQWLVKLPGLGTPGPVDGGAQATAVSPNVGARCKIAKWASNTAGQSVLVYCFTPAGAPYDTRFTMTYQYQRALYGPVAPPKHFGYLWNAPPVGPASTNFNYPWGPGANGLGPAGTGLYVVKFPSLAVLPDDMQVTAAGPGSEFCGLDQPWLHSGPDTAAYHVNCFTNAGVPVDTGFLISDNSAF